MWWSQNQPKGSGERSRYADYRCRLPTRAFNKFFFGDSETGKLQERPPQRNQGTFLLWYDTWPPYAFDQARLQVHNSHRWAETAAVNTVRVVEATLLCSPELIARRSPSVRMSVAQTFFVVL